MFDSSGNDTFIASPTEARLYGTGFDNRVTGFDYVNANSAYGGHDVSVLHDSDGNDTFIAKPDVSYLSGTASGSGSFFNVARGFNNVQAFSTAGGVDVAKFFDGSGNDRMIVRPGYSYMYSPGSTTYINIARGFNAVEAWSTRGGSDRLDQFRGLDYAFTRYGNWDVHSAS